jgi:hypothetical protein
MPIYKAPAQAGPLFITVDPGIMVNVAAFSDLDGEAYNATWIEVGITESLNTLESRIFCFFAGYIMYNNPLAWSGQFFLKQDNQLYLSITGELDPGIKVYDQRIAASGIITGRPRYA